MKSLYQQLNAVYFMHHSN